MAASEPAVSQLALCGGGLRELVGVVLVEFEHPHLAGGAIDVVEQRIVPNLGSEQDAAVANDGRLPRRAGVDAASIVGLALLEIYQPSLSCITHASDGNGCSETRRAEC